MVVKITQVSNACKRLREQWLVHGKCLTKLMIIIDIIILKIIQINRLYLTRIFNAFGNTMLFFKLSCKGFPGYPVVRNPHFHCRGQRFDPWLILHIRSCISCGWKQTNKQNYHVKIYCFSWSLSNYCRVKKNLDIPMNQIFMVKTTKRIEVTKYE